MSRKPVKTTVKPPTVITITLPDEGHLPRTGQILVQRGTLAIIRQFSYSSLNEISTAIQHAAANLIQLEQNPPDIKSASGANTRPEPVASVQESHDATDDNDAIEADAGAMNENDDAPAYEESLPAAISD